MGEYIAWVGECKTGMTIARDVFTDKGAVLMARGTILNDFMIDKLVVNNISKVWIVKSENDEKVEDHFLNESPAVKVAKKEYVKKIENIKDLFQNALTSESIQDYAHEVSSSIMNSESTTGDLLRCIRKLKMVGDYIYTHSLNVASICNLIASWMKLDQKKVEEATIAGLLHDIGKIMIPKEILNKKSELTMAEALEIKKHPEYGYKLLKEKTIYSDDVCEGILMHHEREDGSGYPKGLKGNEINLIAKIVGVADLYSIITLDRVYKRADTPFSVFEIFESPAAQKFDALTVYTLLSNIAMYYVGDNVKLSNGKTGQIFYIDNEFLSRPMVKLSDESIVDLRVEKGVKILEIL